MIKFIDIIDNLSSDGLFEKYKKSFLSEENSKQEDLKLDEILYASISTFSLLIRYTSFILNQERNNFLTYFSSNRINHSIKTILLKTTSLYFFLKKVHVTGMFF